MAKITISAILILAVIYCSEARSLMGSKAQDIEPIGGFLLYRVKNNRIEYLLLKKADENDWSPPKGNLDGNESVFDTAIRETREETALQVCTDYDVYIQYKIYFEYETKKDVLKQVHLWPAEIHDVDKPIKLSDEHSDYAWLPYQEAISTIKEQYRVGLNQGDNIVRAHEQLPN